MVRGARGRGSGLVLGQLLHVTRGWGREQWRPRQVSGGLVWGQDRVLTYDLSAPFGPLCSPLRAAPCGAPSSSSSPGGMAKS